MNFSSSNFFLTLSGCFDHCKHYWVKITIVLSIYIYTGVGQHELTDSCLQQLLDEGLIILKIFFLKHFSEIFE